MLSKSVKLNSTQGSPGPTHCAGAVKGEVGSMVPAHSISKSPNAP